MLDPTLHFAMLDPTVSGLYHPSTDSKTEVEQNTQILNETSQPSF